MFKSLNPLIYTALVAVLIVGAFVAFPGPRPMYHPFTIGLVLLLASFPLIGVGARVKKAGWLFYPGSVAAVAGIGLVVLALARFLG